VSSSPSTGPPTRAPKGRHAGSRSVVGIARTHLDAALVTAAVVGPLAAAAALVPVRGHVQNTNVALVLVVVVVAVAATGRRFAGALAALSASLWFDFFFTSPYLSFTIAHRDGVETTVLLFAVGVVVAELAAWGRRSRAAASQEWQGITRIHAVAEMVAAGEPAETVLRTVADDLRTILLLRDCRFDRRFVGPGTARLERNGEVTVGNLGWSAEHMGLPSGEVDLVVHYRGEPVGRFVLMPTTGQPVSLERRVVAVALADQVGPAVGGRPRSAPTLLPPG
jgi:hypothetical protein